MLDFRLRCLKQRAVLFIAMAFIASAVLSSEAAAWGARGHRTVADIAFERLSPSARKQTEALIGPGKSAFVAVSTWADATSSMEPKLWRHHLVDRPVDAPVYDAQRHCTDAGCLISSIDVFTVVLSNRDNSLAKRTEALKWLVHLVAEVHNPLHVAHDNDRWGEDVWVSIGNTVGNLHWFWDNDLVHALGPSPDGISRSVMTGVDAADLAKWRGGTPVEWAEETFAIARDVIYARSRGASSKANPIVLPEGYAAEAKRHISLCLAKAGVRLAWLLDRVLAE